MAPAPTWAEQLGPGLRSREQPGRVKTRVSRPLLTVASTSREGFVLFLSSVEPRFSDEYLKARPCALGLVSRPPQAQTRDTALNCPVPGAGRTVCDQQLCSDVMALQVTTGQPPSPCLCACECALSPAGAPPGSPTVLGPPQHTKDPGSQAVPPQTLGRGLSPRHCRLLGRATLWDGPLGTVGC